MARPLSGVKRRVKDVPSGLGERGEVGLVTFNFIR